MHDTTGPRLLRINEVASETGLTARSIRYYEEMGLLEPAARSEGDYRLYDASDLERLQFIRGLRDDAGFSLAQIRQLLEDDAARERNRERFRLTGDPDERRALIRDARERVDRQVEILEAKAVRLAEMIEEARARGRHLDAHLAELDGGPAPHPERATSRGSSRIGPVIGPATTVRNRFSESPGVVAFQHRNYRLFFSGQLISLIGTWMQQVAQAWLVLQLTGDPIWLGIVATAQFLPVMVFGLFAGVVADAFPKRRVLIGTQVSMMILAAILAALVIANVVQVWMIVGLAFLLGIANAVDMPVRQSFAVELVGREDVAPAVALNSAMFNGARVVGPAAAGLAIGAFGVAAAFALNALSFLAVIVGLWLMDEGELKIGARIARPTSVAGRGPEPRRGPPLRPPNADRAPRDRRRRDRGDGRHELRRAHPGLRPARSPERRHGLRVPDGRIGCRIAAGRAPPRLRWPAAARAPADRGADPRRRPRSRWRPPGSSRCRWP